MSLEDQQEQLERVMKNFAETMAATTQSMAAASLKHAKAMGADEAELQRMAASLGNARKATDGITEADKARYEAEKKVAESAGYLKDAMGKATTAIGSFAGALLSNKANLTELSGAVSSAGDAALALGKSFGGLGVIVGGLIKGATMLTEAQLKQTQTLLDTKDELTKMGGVGAHTTESIRKMAREADLNTETIGRLVKPMKDLGSNIMVLGGNAGSAQKEFAQLVKTTAEQRAEFSRLGINQEEYMKGTADYIALQSMSGRSIKNELQDRDKLRRASQDYQTNLLDLAALTGKDVNELKAKQKEALRDRQLMIDNAMMESKARKLEAQGRGEEAAQIRKEIEARQAGLGALVNAPKELQKGIKEIMTTGSISGKDAQVLASQGLQQEVEEFQKALKTGDVKKAQEASAKLQDAYAKKLLETTDRVGTAAKLSGDVADRYGLTVESMEWANQQRDKENAKELDQIRKNREAQAKGTGDQKDTAADARAGLQEAQIQAGGKMDDLVAATNPLIGEFNILKGASVALTAAAGAATLALGGLAAGKGLGAVKGLLGGGGGKAAAGAAEAAAGGASKLGGMLKTGGKVLGKLATPLAVGMAAYEGYSDYKSADEKLKKGEITEAEAKKEKGKAVGSATGSAAGGVAGAVIGQMLIPIPGVGAAIGGVAGSWLGGKAGSWLGGKAGAAGAAQPAVAGAPIPGAVQTSSDKKVEKTAEDRTAEKQAKISSEEITNGLLQVSKQLGLNTGELKSLNIQLKKANEQLVKYNEQLETPATDELEPGKITDTLYSAVGRSIKTVLGMGGVGGGGGGGGGAGGGGAGASVSRGGAGVPPGGGKKASGGGMLDTITSAFGGGGGGSSAPVASASGESGPPGEKTGAVAGAGALPDGAVQMGQEVKIGKEVKKGGTVSWRTNNPGNISYGGLAKKYGAIGTWKKLDGDKQQRTTGIAIMPSLDAGDNLKMALWRRPLYIDKTIDEGVMQWTGTLGPGSGYAKSLAQAAGATLQTRLSELSDEQLRGMVKKQRVWEGFKEGQTLQAKTGGLASGPKTGYPATLHGNEIIVPLDPNSILAELGKKSAAQIQNQMAEKSASGSSNSMSAESFKELIAINQSLKEMMEEKMDNMISKLETGNDTQGKILKYSQA